MSCVTWERTQGNVLVVPAPEKLPAPVGRQSYHPEGKDHPEKSAVYPYAGCTSLNSCQTSMTEYC